MKVGQFKLLGREKAPNWAGIKKEMETALEAKVKPRLLDYAERIVANWEHKPEFRAMKRFAGGSVSVYIYPTGENKKYWVWTSRGTEPHPIEPKTASVLAFPSVYTPKTQPRGPSYGGPGTSGGPTVFTMHVDHPGTKPRHFEEAWSRWARTWYAREMQEAVTRGAQKA